MGLLGASPGRSAAGVTPSPPSTPPAEGREGGFAGLSGGGEVLSLEEVWSCILPGGPPVCAACSSSRAPSMGEPDVAAPVCRRSILSHSAD